MDDRIVDKARENRAAALDYVQEQKRKLVSLTGYRPGAGAERHPIPSFGFSSSRTERKGSLEAV